jgi:pimeloyl-ACP methyl ester carboxylesterase
MNRIDVHGTTIAFERAGHGNPVVLVHGNFASRRWWTDLLQAPPDDLALYAPDLPGFGASGPLTGELTIDAYADALDGFLAALGLERPVVVGHSLGGSVAQAQAVRGFKARAVTRPSALLLVSSGEPGGLQTPEAHYPLLESLRGNREGLRASLQPMTPTRTPPNFEDLLDDALAMAPRAYSGNARALAAMDLTGRTATVRCPVGVLRGALDPLITEEMARATAAAYAGAQLVTWDGVGHSPQIEDPERFATLLDAFVGGRPMT